MLHPARECRLEGGVFNVARVERLLPLASSTHARTRREKPKVDRIDELIEAGEWAQALELAAAQQDAVVHAHVARLVWHSSRPTESSPATLKRAYHALLGTTYSEQDARLVVAGAIRLATALGTTPSLAHAAIDLALNAVQLSVQQQGRTETTAQARRTLLELKDRTSTYEALYVVAAAVVAEEQVNNSKTPRIRHGRTFSVAAPPPEKEAATGEDEEAEGWGEIDLPSEEPPSDTSDADADTDTDLPPPPSLSTFLATPLTLSALSLASLAALPELCLLCSLHPTLLWPARADILDAIPLWVDPQAYVDLLPEIIELKGGDDDVESGQEEEKEREGWAEAQPWRAEPDWSELPPYVQQQPQETPSVQARPRTASAVREWYLARVSAHVAAGFIDEALSLIQHGAAARNVTGLEETGEDVSLLARLVHDRPPPPTLDEDRPWTLERWRRLEPNEVIEAYTATCTPQDLAQTIKSLVMPYLHVLQARTERRRQRRRSFRTTQGSLEDDEADDGATPENSPTEHLYDYILSLPPRSPPRSGPGRPAAPSGLELFLAVVEASIPTLPPSRRLVSSDSDLARLAIAALYGAGSAGATNRAAVVMSRVFECLPAFESPSPSPPPPPSRLDNDRASSSAADDDDDADLFSLAAAHNNNSKGSAPPPSAAPPPAEIFRALSSASPAALSAHLDTLDLHLSQLETFLRYSSPPSTSGLAWFLASYRDRAAQLQWATRLARTASIGGGEDGSGEFESEDEWVGLMEFMADATGVAPQPTEGGGSSMDREEAIRKGLGRAFCLLERDEVLRIFFGGLLAAGRAFPPPTRLSLDPNGSLVLIPAS